MKVNIISNVKIKHNGLAISLKAGEQVVDSEIGEALVSIGAAFALDVELPAKDNSESSVDIDEESDSLGEVEVNHELSEENNSEINFEPDSDSDSGGDSDSETNGGTEQESEPKDEKEEGKAKKSKSKASK